MNEQSPSDQPWPYWFRWLTLRLTGIFTTLTGLWFIWMAGNMETSGHLSAMALFGGLATIVGLLVVFRVKVPR